MDQYEAVQFRYDPYGAIEFRTLIIWAAQDQQEPWVSPTKPYTDWKPWPEPHAPEPSQPREKTDAD